MCGDQLRGYAEETDSHMESSRKLVVFALDDLRCGLPLERVARVVRAVQITPLPGAPRVILGMINVHGKLVPVADLRQRFQLPSRDLSIHDHMLIAWTPRRLLAVVADAVRGVVECAQRDVLPVDDSVPSAGHVRGVAKLGDGLLVIHDLDQFLSLDEEAAVERALADA